MAITANTIEVVEIPSAGNDWHVSLYSADVRGCEEIKAAEAGRIHYIKKLLIHCASTDTITLGSGATAGAVTTIHLGPVPLNAANANIDISFGRNKGMKCTSGAAFCIDSGAASPVMIYCEGKTCTKTV